MPFCLFILSACHRLVVPGECFQHKISKRSSNRHLRSLPAPCSCSQECRADVCARGLQESALEDVGNLSWGAFKPVLADAVIAHLAPLQQQYAAVMSDPAYLDEVQLLRNIANLSSIDKGIELRRADTCVCSQTICIIHAQYGWLHIAVVH